MIVEIQAAIVAVAMAETEVIMAIIAVNISSINISSNNTTEEIRPAVLTVAVAITVTVVAPGFSATAAV